MPRRRTRRITIPPPLDDELCRQLPFAHPDPDARLRLVARADAADQHGARLTAAERAALERLHHAVAVINLIDELLVRHHRQPIASRVLRAHAGEVVVAVLWRTRSHHEPRDPYTIQLARHVDTHLTMLSVADGLRVDHAWPLYHLQTWPPTS